MGNIVFEGQSFAKIDNDSHSSISESIKRILLTEIGERTNNVFFGSRISDYIFDSEVVAVGLINNEITRAISVWEPRVSIESINFEKNNVVDRNKLYVSLVVKIKKTNEKIKIEVGV